MTSIAEYYISELEDWREVIHFYLEEIGELEKRLSKTLNFYTVIGLIAVVKNNLDQLLLSRQNWIILQGNLQSFKNRLYLEKLPVENALITERIKQQQDEFRKIMHSTEKEYLSIKYNCADFLAEAFTGQYKN